MPQSGPRWILHVDMDAFYASVEQRDDPSLKGRPVIVGGTGPRCVVAAASYEARKFGVRSAMPMREALSRCPDAICVRPRMSHYQSVSRQIFTVFSAFTPLIEGLSLDEAFLDVTASIAAFGPADSIAAEIKRRVLAETALTCSVGVAPNKLVAKIASELRKPDGLVVVRPDGVTALLDPLTLRRLFGLGPKTAPRVEALGIRTLGELRHASTEVLRPVFGRYAERVRERAAGIDDRPVVPDLEEVQISSEETFDTDIEDHAQLRSELVQLADRSGARLRERGLAASCVTVKIRRADFATYTRQRHIAPPTQETQVISRVGVELLDAWLATQPTSALRLLGVGVTELGPAVQLDLFTAPESARNQHLDGTLDRIRGRFGRFAVARASSLPDASEVHADDEHPRKPRN